MALFPSATLADQVWNSHAPAALFRHIVHRSEATMLTTILVIVLILLLIGALPRWGYSRGWGYGPGGGLGLILLIIIILALTGHI
jgi:uncharacterized protein DUF3309